MAFYIYDMLNILLEEKFAMAHDQYGNNSQAIVRSVPGAGWFCYLVLCVISLTLFMLS